MIRKVLNVCKMCEILVRIATTIDKPQQSEYLKPTFLDTFKWAGFPRDCHIYNLLSHVYALAKLWQKRLELQWNPPLFGPGTSIVWTV